MSDRWQEMAVFARVAEVGSLSRAARELRLSQPSVSRLLASLEGRLDTKLLLRTTRSVALTDAGALFLERAKHLLAEVEEAEQAARGIDSLHGVIRLAMPVLFGARAVIPSLSSFLAKYPDLSVEMTMSDARQNLVVEGVDVAIRLSIRNLDDSTFGAKRLALIERFAVASPDYLAARGEPATPADLALHDCIVQHGVFGRENWRFIHNDTVTSVDVRAKMTINSVPGILAASVAGMGISLATAVMAGEELRNGTLVRVLKPYRMEPAEVYAVFPAGPHPSAKVRALVDHLAASLRTAEPTIEADR